MRSPLVGIVLLGWLAVGCNRDKPPPPAAPSPPAAASTTQAPAQPPPAPPPSAPVAADAGPETPAAAPTARLPAPRWEKLPGWLGHASVKPEAKPENAWTPAHPKARVVLFSEDWKDVPAGARVRLVGASGVTQEGTYLGTSTEPYGCEQNTATFAAFSAPQPFPEGPVWVLPPHAQEAQAVPVRDVPVSELPAPLLKRAGVAKARATDVRAYEAGGLTFVLARKGRLKGLMTVFQDEQPVATEELEKGDMEGTDTSPLDLFSPHEVGVPHPLAAFRLGGAGPLAVVLTSRSYEGYNFWLATRRAGKVTLHREDGEYLYFCAF